MDTRIKYLSIFTLKKKIYREDTNYNTLNREMTDDCPSVKANELEQRLIIIATGATKVNALLFNFYVGQIALSHGTDVDTLDRSAIRLCVSQVEDIEFPGFRRSNQFVAIRAAADSSLPWASFYESNPPPPPPLAVGEGRELVFAQPSKLKTEICTFDMPVANLIRLSSTSSDPSPAPLLSSYPLTRYTLLTR